MMRLDNRRILVVEDDPLLREILDSYLTNVGASVTAAKNGTMAIELLSASAFDAVITDLRMPGGDGMTLVKNINKEITPKPLIFVCSGYTDLGDEDRFNYGITEFFEKPFSGRALAEVIGRAFATDPKFTLVNE
jgi:CheY-like chemotaxis protein